MKKLSAGQIKILKVFHLVFVMMWVVGVAAMALLCLIKANSGDELFMVFHITRFIDDVFVIPGAILTVVTGIVYGAFSNWGFFKHRWIMVKWILSILIIVIGTFYFSPLLDNTLTMIDHSRDIAFGKPQTEENIQTIFIGGICQGSALVFLVVISVLKPWKQKKQA